MVTEEKGRRKIPIGHKKIPIGHKKIPDRSQKNSNRSKKILEHFDLLEYNSNERRCQNERNNNTWK